MRYYTILLFPFVTVFFIIMVRSNFTLAGLVSLASLVMPCSYII